MLTTSVTGYDHHYRPSGQTVTVPTNTTLPSGLTGSYTTEYTYTATGLPKTTYLQRAGNLLGETVTTTYDSANQPHQMIGGADGAYVVESEYSEYGDLLFADLGGNWSVGARWTYDINTRRLTEQSVTREGAAGDDVVARYSYDQAGNVLGIKNNPTATGVNPDRQCFSYDGLRRLTNAWTPNNGDCATANRTVDGLGGADPYWTSYTYDAVGNPKTVTQNASETNGGIRTSTNAYPTAGGAAGSKPHAVTGVTTKDSEGATVGTSSFSYDQAGNMTGRTLAGQTAQTLAWDAEGELTSLAQDGNGDGDTADVNETDKYLYSADGERLVRTQDGASTLYLPGGMELTAYADGRASTANRYYSFNGTTITTRAAIGATGQTTVIPDHHGTPMLQVDQSANRVTRQYTDPFGATRGAVAGDADADGRLDGTSPAWVGDHGYLDKPEDTSGLTAIGARMYDPVLGRFISVDPVMDLADPQQWNPYAYSNSNPLTWSDPTGLIFYGGDGNRHTETASHRKSATDYANKRGRFAPKPTVAPPWSPPAPAAPFAPWYSSPTTYAGHGLTAAGIGVSDATGMAERKSTEISSLKKPQKNSGTPGRQVKLDLQRKEVSAARGQIHTNSAVRGAVGIAKSPLAQRAAGPVGVGVGVIIGMPNYHDANGGDWAFAGMQAGQDAAFAAAGGWAAGAAMGVLVGLFALTGIGAIILIGAAVVAGAAVG